MQQPIISLATVLSLSSFISSSIATHNPKTCTEYSVAVSPTSSNLIWPLPFRNNFDVVDFITASVSRTAQPPTFKSVNQTANYTISATSCTPTEGLQTTSALEILVYRSSYWDPKLHSGNYSFVDHAISLGYSTFFYDRLGVGESTMISGYLNQASIQVAILSELTTSIKKGCYTSSFGIPKKVVLVGHSFGSVLSAAIAAASPTLIDGVVLFDSYNGTNGAGFLEAFAPRIANGESSKWKSLDNGYLSAADVYSNVNAFFKAPDYDVQVAEWAHRNRQPFGINEAISGGLVNVLPLKFKGVGLIVTGQFDLIFCTGQCDDVLEHPATDILSNARAFKAISYPGSGYGLNFTLNASGAFKIVTDFLGANGL